MSRFGECWDMDEEDERNSRLWWANAERALKGKRGRKVLVELEAALLALPRPRLMEGRLSEAEGEYCALGALAHARGVADERMQQLDSLVDFDGGPTIEPTLQLGRELGICGPLAAKIASVNDKEITYVGGAGFVPETPEQRFSRVLAWVRDELRGHA